jgi:cysteine desulfurase
MIVPSMPIYLDCAATTPLDPRVREEMLRCLDDDFGNAGSRTHKSGERARALVERARDRVAAVVASSRGDVIFTSGATESNNLALLGLAASATDRRHIVSTAVEHRAVLEPLTELGTRGFTVTLIEPSPSGVVDAAAVLAAIRPDTLLVSVMHVNNETGVIQPIDVVAAGLKDHGVYMHVDAAQSFARELEALRHPRIDLISASAHKIGGPKGVGALIARRRDGPRPPLQPLMFGGGQERGLRPGTLPVALIAGFGLAAEINARERDDNYRKCHDFRQALLRGLAPLQPTVNGDLARSVPYIISLAFPGLDANDVMLAWLHDVEISDGAACTTQSQTCSHVLSAMQVDEARRDGTVRLSWTAATEEPNWTALVEELETMRDGLRANLSRVGTV